ncbi:hypothetical protein C8J57DRAFT_1351596 [Mycena rebaudengoi]|nr:hypothetical protein C8J57DRAFT_1351596 [Mycena rebaudengoi]
MSTHYRDWNSPPHYGAGDDSASYSDTSTLLSSQKPASQPRYVYGAGDDSASYTASYSDSGTLVNSQKPASQPRYVYYRVYTLDGMLHCKKHDQNPFIGRIKAISVPPPHTVASLKRVLVQAEGLPDPSGNLTGLFQTREARKPMVTNARVDILNGDLGATTQTPVALVFLTSPKEALHAPSNDDGNDYDGNELPLLYYRLYNRGGEEKSMRSFDTTEPALGRVKRESIAPPRNVLSVKRRIARAEGNAIYEMADLFMHITADNARPADSLVEDTWGSSEENPILIVQPERRPGVYNRPVLVVALPLECDPSRYPYGRYGSNNTHWLSPPVGTIVYTDGVARSENGTYYSVYTAVDQNGNKGCQSTVLLLSIDSRRVNSSHRDFST